MVVVVLVMSVAPLNTILKFFVVLEIWKIFNLHYNNFLFLSKNKMVEMQNLNMYLRISL